MPFAAWHKTIQDNAGNRVVGANVSVTDEDTGLPAVLYKDRNGNEFAGNPVKSDGNGQVLFFVVGGAYRITATKDGFSSTLRYQGIGLAGEFDFLDITDLMSGTSLTTAAVGLGLKNFIVTEGGDRAWKPGAYLVIASDANPDNVMYGIIESYDTDGDLVVNVFRRGGTGSFNDWTLSLAGVDGLEGVPGISFEFDTSTAMSDPGARAIRFNNADPSLVTQIAVDDLAAALGSPDVSAYILTWDDSTSTSIKGHLIVKRTDDPDSFAIYSLTSLVDDAGWTLLNVTFLSGSATLANTTGQPLNLSFIRIGDIGATGPGGNVTSIGGIQALQFIVSVNAPGTQIKGADMGDSPSTAVIVGTDAGVRAASAGHVLTAGLLETAAAFQTLTDAATIAVDWDTFINASVLVTANRTLGNPTNGQPGTSRIVLVQGNVDASPVTQRTLIFGNQYLGELPTLTDISDTRLYLLTIFCITTTHFAVSAKRVSGTPTGT